MFLTAYDKELITNTCECTEHSRGKLFLIWILKV